MELGTITALVMLLLGLSHVFDHILKEPQVRTVHEKINLWFDQLGQVQDESILKKNAVYFVELFDAIYGEKHFSWKCFWRSSVASLIVVFITLLIWEVLYSSDVRWEKFSVLAVCGIFVASIVIRE